MQEFPSMKLTYKQIHQQILQNVESIYSKVIFKNTFYINCCCFKLIIIAGKEWWNKKANIQFEMSSPKYSNSKGPIVLVGC